MLEINDDISIPDWCLQITAIRSQGPGGQHVNKNATGIHLRMHIQSTPMPEYVKTKLRNLKDRRISQDGWVIIKATQNRSQERNKQEALERLKELVLKALIRRKPRRASGPSRASIERRLQNKKKRGDTKARRQDKGDDGDY